jgi:putative sigma-54 modulation protein
MEINIQSLSFHASDKLTDFTLDKVNKLAQYTDRIVHAEVILKTDKSERNYNKFCEIRICIPGHDLFASKQQVTFEEAVLKTVEALKQQLLSWKEKSQDKSYTSTSGLMQSDDQF